MGSSDDDWMTSGEVATAAGIPPRRVYAAADTGGLPAYRIGRYIRFRRDEVEVWIARREQIGKRTDQ